MNDIDAEIAKDDAADEMERLRAENAQLAAAHNYFMPAYMKDCKCNSCVEARTKIAKALDCLLSPTIELLELVRESFLIHVSEGPLKKIEAELARLRAVKGEEK